MDASGDLHKAYKRMQEVLTVVEGYLLRGDDSPKLLDYVGGQKEYYKMKQK